MSKLLIISDNEVLNSLFIVNLKIYLDFDSVIATNVEEAIEIIENYGDKIVGVISQAMINEEDAALIALHHLVFNGFDTTPLVAIGKIDDPPENINIIRNQFDLRGIIQAIAKPLGVTAKDMAKKKVPDYYPIPLKMFFSIKRAICETFYLVKDEESESEAKTYHTIFQASDTVWPKIKSFADENVSSLYIKSEDRFKLVHAVTDILIDEMNNISEDTDIDERLEVVEQGIETIAEQLFDAEITDQVVELSSKCMDAMTDVIADLPDLKALILGLSQNKSGFLYSHSIITGFVADHIVDNMEWGGEAHKEKLKFVLFFHDMYLVKVYKEHPELTYEDQVIFDDRLTEAEKEIVVNHANEAAEALKRYPKCPMGVDAIIRQHHGTTNGVGFATSYKDDISPLAKVLIIAEAFTEELLKEMHEGNKINKDNLISIISTKFKRKTYLGLIETLHSIKL